jgi:rSAM/selenodomain-associated transferase 1
MPGRRASGLDAATTCAIAIMAKAPEAGRSKTRLCPPLTAEEAAALSGAFLRDTADNLREAARHAPIAPYAAYAPLGSEARIAGHVGAGTDLILADGSPPMPDRVEGFGRCLLHAVEGMIARGHAAACVLSSDSPTLPTRILVEAAERLLAPGARAVLGASDDGGYYVLGLKTARPEMFADIAWSTETVAATTRERAREIGLDLVELDPWYDVDDAASLSVLLRESAGYRAPATAAVLGRLDLRDRLIPSLSPA